MEEAACTKPATIVGAIRAVLLREGRALSHQEIYNYIIDAKLYDFHADDPASIVRSQIRRHCQGLDFATASPTKHFQITDDRKYVLRELDLGSLRSTSECNVTPRLMSLDTGNRCSDLAAEPETWPSILVQLQDLRRRHVEDVRRRVLADLAQLSPAAFERFGRRLMIAYGFENVHVTQVSRDGGVDGHGTLKVGLARLNVAFQCKRWTSARIYRPEIDKFRGAIQGDFEQGVLFTTSRFAEGAIRASIKRGAVPIVLIDGPGIFDIMVEKSLGIAFEEFRLPTYALDLALEE